MLLSEAAWEVATVLRAHSKVVQGGLLRSHAARVSVKGTHDGMGAAMEGRSGRRVGVVGDGDARLLCRRELLDEAVGGAGAGLRVSPLVCRLH